jgi:hypothetical protein
VAVSNAAWLLKRTSKQIGGKRAVVPASSGPKKKRAIFLTHLRGYPKIHRCDKGFTAIDS